MSGQQGTTPLTADAFEARVGEEFLFARPGGPDGASGGVMHMKLELEPFPPD